MSPGSESPTTLSHKHFLLNAVESQQLFRAFAGALARPGPQRPLSRPPRLAHIPSALLFPMALGGPSVSVMVVSPSSIEARRWQQALHDGTGVRLTANPGDADIVVALDASDIALPAVISQLRVGEAETPESAAKLAISCAEPSPSGCQGSSEITGPGVAGSVGLAAPGVPSRVLDAIAAANGIFPLGIDTWFFDGDGRVSGLPRSSIVVHRGSVG